MNRRHRTLVPVADITVMRGHDLYAGCIKDILDILMKQGIGNMLLVGIPGICIYLVVYIKIIQMFLKYKRSGIFFNQISRQRSLYEQFMNLSPGSIITNRYARMKNQTFFSRFGAEVGCVTAHHRRVGYGNNFIFDSHYFGYQNGFRSEERRVGKECRSRWSPY